MAQVKEALREKPRTQLKASTGTVKAALPPVAMKQAPKRKGTVKRALVK